MEICKEMKETVDMVLDYLITVLLPLNRVVDGLAGITALSATEIPLLCAAVEPSKLVWELQISFVHKLTPVLSTARLQVFNTDPVLYF